MRMIWGDSETDRRLRRFLALQIMFAIGGALVVAYLLWPPLSRDKETTESAGRETVTTTTTVELTGGEPDEVENLVPESPELRFN